MVGSRLWPRRVTRSPQIPTTPLTSGSTLLMGGRRSTTIETATGVPPSILNGGPDDDQEYPLEVVAVCSVMRTSIFERSPRNCLASAVFWTVAITASGEIGYSPTDSTDPRMNPYSSRFTVDGET